VLEEIARTPSPTRHERHRYVAVVLLVLFGALAVTWFFTGGVVKGNRPPDLVVFAAGFAGIVAVAITQLSARRSRSMLGPARSTLVLASLSAPLLWGALVFLIAAFWPGPAAEGVPMTEDVGCALLTLVQGMLPMAALVIAKRGTDPVHPMLTGVAFGIVAGAWAVAMAYLRCPHAAAVHGLVAHAVPALLLGVAGALVGRAFVAVR
jgi:hypothetical protein